MKLCRLRQREGTHDCQAGRMQSQHTDSCGPATCWAGERGSAYVMIERQLQRVGHGAVLCCAKLCCAELSCAELYCAVLCCAVPCRAALCCGSRRGE